MGVHDGHRARRRALFREQGLGAFSDYEVLELLLFYAMPRVDTSTVAHRLMDHFGSLDAVLTAAPEELERLDGVGESAATLLALLMPICRRARTVASENPVILVDPEKIGRFFLELFYGVRTEHIYAACLDAKGKLLRCTPVAEGVDTSQLNVRRLVELASQCNATSVILAHNHPSGVALPSPDDIDATHSACEALRGIGVRLSDHLVVADDDYVSLADNGVLPRDKDKKNKNDDKKEET